MAPMYTGNCHYCGRRQEVYDQHWSDTVPTNCKSCMNLIYLAIKISVN